MNNIAEGFARGTDGQFAHFLSIARGSAAEIGSMLYLLEDIAPQLAAQIPAVRDRLDLTVALIAKLTSYLRNSRLAEDATAYAAPELANVSPSQRTSGLPDLRTSGP